MTRSSRVRELRAEQANLDRWRRQITAGDRVAPDVTCRRCNGYGCHAMPTVYAAVYTLLTNEWQDTSTISAKLPRVGNTALCNRLAWLRREGFAQSRQAEHNGRMGEWRRKP